MPRRLKILKVLFWVVGTPLVAYGIFSLFAHVSLMAQGLDAAPGLLLAAVAVLGLGLALWVTAMYFGYRRRGTWTAAFALSILLTILFPLTPVGVAGIFILVTDTARRFFGVGDAR